jgi:tRNA(fMet)-specific endonuclease VapC
MTMWILDTDHVTLWQRRHLMVIRRIASVDASQLATTIVTLEEQLRGRLDQVNRAMTGQDVKLAYRRLEETYIFFQRLTRLEFSDEAELHYGELVRQRVRIGTRDLRIAAIALSVGGIIVTRNRRDFERVPGLAIEDWSIAP